MRKVKFMNPTVRAIRKHARLLAAISLVLVVAFAALSVFTRMSGPRESQTEDWAAQRAGQLVAQWEAEYAEQDLYTKTPIHLGFSRAFSEHFTEARGTGEINFQTGRVAVSVDGLDPRGSAYEVWLVENVSGLRNTAAIDLGRDGDRILNLGALPADGSLVTFVDREKLANFEIDMAVVMRMASDRKPEFVIGGMQSIRFQIGREAKINPNKPAGNFVAAGFAPAAFAAAQSNNSKKVTNLIVLGQGLFLNGTFGGNGRTCATCHRLEANLSMDKAFIGTLSPTDPLFVTEFPSNFQALPDFDPALPNKPAMEDGGSSGLMRERGLTLVNLKGFARDAAGDMVNAPVFRASPSLFNMSFTAPFGYSACCADLLLFSAGAVIQHFPKDVQRRAGVDFVVPTAAELRALEAFMLSNTSPVNGNFKISGPGSLLSTKQDPKATNITRPEVRGRNLFSATNSCITCHAGTVLSGGITNLNTGVEAFEHRDRNPFRIGLRTPTVDDGDNLNLGKFQIPQLFGMRKTHFFHSGVLGNNVASPTGGHTQLFMNLRTAVSFYQSFDFAASPEGQLRLPLPDGSLRFQGILDMTPAQIDDIAAFLEAISKP